MIYRGIATKHSITYKKNPSLVCSAYETKRGWRQRECTVDSCNQLLIILAIHRITGRRRAVGEGGGGGGGGGNVPLSLGGRGRGSALSSPWAQPGEQPQSLTHFNKSERWPLRTTRTDAYAYDSLFITQYCRINGETSLFMGVLLSTTRNCIIHSCIVIVIAEANISK